MERTATTTIGLRASDVSGQKVVRASGVSTALTVTELVQRLIDKMNLSKTSADGRPLAYQARLERSGRHLHGSETVGDALSDDDEVVLTPDISAG
jgi:molybdopterin converting factor small subunit